MDGLIETASTACEWGSAYLLIFSENVGSLIYYSHLLPLIVSLVLGVFVLINNPKKLANQVLFFMTLMFSAWVYFDLILWASPSPEAVMFFWSSIVPIEMLIYASALYLIYIFVNGQKDISLAKKLSIAVFFIPILLFAHTPLNVVGLSPDCDEGAIEGPLIQFMYVVELLYIVWGGIVVARGYRKLADDAGKKQLLYIGIGTILFLMIFTAGNITLVFSLDPLYEQYKLFGMPIFTAFVAYTIVRFKTFNAKLVTAQALVAALAISVVSLLFIRSIENIRVITAITFVFVITLGAFLIKSVQKEIRQRQQLEELTKSLSVANEKLKSLDRLKTEFLSLAAHQLRSPLTAIKGYTSMLVDGSFGALDAKQKEMVDRVYQSSDHLAHVVEDLLNVSKIEQGGMQYEITQFDAERLLADLARDLSVNSEKKGILLSFAGTGEECVIHGDQEKLRQVFINLIDNGIKYTNEGGAIAVQLEKLPKRKKIRVSFIDNGVGIPKDIQETLFQKFNRGNGSKMNTGGSGLGLYLAKQIVEAHKGTIWVESEGDGKGSAFFVELPM